MQNNLTKNLFLLSMMGGTMISISSNSWLGAWMGLEINLLSFIPIMSSSKNTLSTEASLKYFLVQALASTILLFSIILFHLSNSMSLLLTNNILQIMISSALMLKMGAAPLHFWFPGVMEGLNWMNCFILMIWQKIAPIMLLSYVIKINSFTFMIIIMSVLIGSIGGINQTSMRKILAYSSINHLGWMITAMITGENLWMMYFLIYSLLTTTLIFMFQAFKIFHINQTFSLLNNNTMLKFSLFMCLLSLGGLPPFLGFLPKWLVIQSMAENNMFLLITLMVVMTLITLFYYLRVCYSAFLLSHNEIKWNNKTNYSNNIIISSMMLTTMSTTGLIMCSTMFNIL